jgi:DNA invertase Pin-like site-specific DNA recombinase
MTSDTSIDSYADVSDPSGEPICVWERVSTDMTRQEIASQTADLRAFIGAGAYCVRRVFRFEASAFHGKHAPQQAEMLADVEAGLYRTVIAAMSSRYERRGVKHALRFALDLDLYGARVVAVDDPNYGDMDSELGIIGTVFKAKSNYDYSKAISDNVARRFRLMDAEGAHRGAIPAGYVATGDKGHKNLQPHPDGSAAVVQAFLDCATGKSTPKIARTFRGVNTRCGTRLPVTPDGVAKMLRNEDYSTGHHAEGAACKCKFAPLVSPAQQRLAIAALDGRRTGDNVSSRAITKEDYSGALFCGVCMDLGITSKMYRLYAGARPKAGTPMPPIRRYKCQTCIRSVKADNADETLNAIMGADIVPWWIPFTTDPNADRDRELADVAAELKALPSQGLSEDEEDTRRAELRAERKRLQAIEDQDAETFATRKTDAAGRGLTEGTRWTDYLTFGERRDYLTSGVVYASVKAAGDRSGNVVVNLVPGEGDEE